MPPMPVAIFSKVFRSRTQRAVSGKLAPSLSGLQVEGIFGAKQDAEQYRSPPFPLTQLDFFRNGFAFFEQEDQHGIAQHRFDPRAGSAAAHRYAIDQRAVATAQISDRILLALSRNRAVPPRQCRVSHPELVGGLSSNGYFADRQRELRAFQRDRLYPAAWDLSAAIVGCLAQIGLPCTRGCEIPRDCVGPGPIVWDRVSDPVGRRAAAQRN